MFLLKSKMSLGSQSVWKCINLWISKMKQYACLKTTVFWGNEVQPHLCSLRIQYVPIRDEKMETQRNKRLVWSHVVRHRNVVFSMFKSIWCVDARKGDMAGFVDLHTRCNVSKVPFWVATLSFCEAVVHLTTTLKLPGIKAVFRSPWGLCCHFRM